MLPSPSSSVVGGETVTPKSERSIGLRNFVVGLILFPPGLLLFVFARDWLLDTFGVVDSDQVTMTLPRLLKFVLGAPMVLGYFALVTGLYKLLFGARGEGRGILWSVFRIVFGVLVTIGIFLVAAFVSAQMRR